MKSISFSVRILADIKKLVFFQLVATTFAVSAFSYFDFSSELKLTEKLISEQLITNLAKMLNYGEILYLQPLLESTVKSSNGRFNVYIILKKLPSLDTIAFSGDDSVTHVFYKLVTKKKMSAPYFGEIEIQLFIGYGNQILKSIEFYLMSLAICTLLAYLIYIRIQKQIFNHSVSVDELESILMDDDNELVATDALGKAKKVFLEFAENRAKNSVLESLALLGKQVSHDIRSPLAALEIISGDLREIQDERRLVLRNAIVRIREIANSLNSSNYDQQDVNRNIETMISTDWHLPLNEVKKNTLLSLLVEEIIFEKRIEFQDRKNINIFFELDDHSFCLFSIIQPNELKRAISNIINNSIDAIESKYSTQIRIELYLASSEIIHIKVSDLGKGISAENLTKIMIAGATFGKKNGTGLGLAHAKKTLNFVGGDISITSKIGEGTTVCVSLPLATPDFWLRHEIKILENQTVLLLDEDKDVHDTWRTIFTQCRENGLIIVHFESVIDLKKYYSLHFDILGEGLFLINYGLNTSHPGLDLVQELGIEAQSILLTDSKNEAEIRILYEKFNVYCLPKAFAKFVKIKIK